MMVSYPLPMTPTRWKHTQQARKKMHSLLGHGVFAPQQQRNGAAAAGCSTAITTLSLFVGQTSRVFIPSSQQIRCCLYFFFHLFLVPHQEFVMRVCVDDRLLLLRDYVAAAAAACSAHANQRRTALMIATVAPLCCVCYIITSPGRRKRARDTRTHEPLTNTRKREEHSSSPC